MTADARSAWAAVGLDGEPQAVVPAVALPAQPPGGGRAEKIRWAAAELRAAAEREDHVAAVDAARREAAEATGGAADRHKEQERAWEIAHNVTPPWRSKPIS